MNATGTSPVAEGRPDQPSVVVAEADVLAREGLATLLQHSSVEVHGVAAHMNELIKRIELSRPNVVVTPVDLPPAGANGGIAAALHIKRRFPLTGIVVLADDRGRDPAVDLLTRAATGIAYLVRGDIASLTDLVDVVRMVAKGGSAVDARVLANLLRTREVLRMIALGYSNRAIAESLHVAECTVEKHVGHVFVTLGIRVDPRIHRRVLAALIYCGVGHEHLDRRRTVAWNSAPAG
jgi:DNA-binding NarL/FixJ family response regulator